MGEPTCVMHPFSYTSGVSNESNQGNPRHALGDSISFGRFMSDSIAWEKWSSFSHNRYVEEAERYAQPGSVAQKKAFFEAHYKKIAAKKAAALLDQQQNAGLNTTEQEFEAGVCDNTTTIETQPLVLNTQSVVEEQEQANADVCGCNDNMVEPENGKTEGGDSLMTEQEVLVENPTNEKLYSYPEHVEDQNMVSGDVTEIPQMERPLLKNSSSIQDVSSPMIKKKPLLSSLKKSVCRRPSKIPASPAKPRTAIHAKKENVTPTPRKSKIDDVDKSRPTPKSLQRLIHFTPSKEPCEPTYPTSQSSRVPLSAVKAMKECATPLRTPKMAIVNRVHKQPSATPCSENRRVKTPVDPTTSGNKTAGTKWHLLSSVYTKSVSACRRKLQTPTLSTPFNLRTEERAARRKQKLEEKFNANEEQKVQLQTKLKEKAEMELRRLRQSFCFKARPLPDFYKEREAPKKQIKQASPSTMSYG